MAIESYLSNFAEPKINSVNLKKQVSTKLLENIVQQRIFKDGEAVTEKYSDDPMCAQVQVIRVRQIAEDARQLGVGSNGGWFNNSDAETSSTEAVALNLDFIMDKPIDIPGSAVDMCAVDLAEAEVANYRKRVTKNHNATILATCLAKKLNAMYSSSDVTPTDLKYVTLDSTPDYKKKILTGLGYLDNGNGTYIEAYDEEARAIYLRPDAANAMLADGTIVAGIAGSLAVGSLDDSVGTVDYCGKFGNAKVYKCGDAIWTLAEKYLGLSAGDLDNVSGVILAGQEIAFGYAESPVAEFIPAYKGRGVRMITGDRWGAACWNSRAVIPIVTSSYTAVGTGTLVCKPAGSR